MKPWLVFSSGVLLGAAAMLGISQRGKLSGRSRMPEPVSVGPLVGGSADEPLAVDVTQEKEKTVVDLDKGIARLRDWAEGRAGAMEAGQREEVLAAWAERDPHAALAFVMNARRYPGRARALGMPLAVIGRTDIGFVVQWLRQNLSEGERGEAATVTVDALLSLSPESATAALELAFAEKISVDAYAIGRVLAALVSSDSMAATQGFARLSEEGRQASAANFVAAWAGKDAGAAERWCEQQRGSAHFEAALRGLIESSIEQRSGETGRLVAKFADAAKAVGSYLYTELLKKDREQGLAVLRLLPKEEAISAVGSWAAEVMENDPEGALATIRAMVPTDKQSEFASEGFQRWCRSDRRAASEWLKKQPDNPITQSLRMQERLLDVGNDPKGALTWLMTQPEVPEKASAISGALEIWGERDPVGAAAWISANAARAQPNAGAQVARYFLMRDEAAGASWLATLPQGPVRDEAVSVAAEYWVNQGDIEYATEAARSVGDPEKKLAAMFTVFSALRSSEDAALADKWLAEQGISEETRITWRALAGGSRETIRSRGGSFHGVQ